jgi:hypothetical protein
MFKVVLQAKTANVLLRCIFAIKLVVLVYKDYKFGKYLSPVRVLVVSPLTNDASALNKGKIAATKTDYIIEPVKITVEKTRQ